MTVEKPKPKQLLRPITTGAGSAMNQSQFLEIICSSLKAREESHVHGAIGFGFASHWLKNWRESFKPITKRSNRDHAITFDSHLKTALCTNTRFLLFFSSSRVQFSFERMPLLGWIRCLICSALLFSSNPSEPASGTQATDQHRLPVSIDETGSFLCSCSDKKGRTYNLASLAKRDGNPRFVKN